MLNSNLIVKKVIFVVMCLSFVLFNGCITLKIKPAREKNEYSVNEGKSKVFASDKEDKPSISEDKTGEVLPFPDTQGAGYLSRGATINLGIMDGDEEITLLKKIKRLEARLEKERKEKNILRNTYDKKLSDLQAFLDSTKKELADTKKELEDRNQELLETIKVLESELNETEARTIAAEKELRDTKKELLGAQLSEIRAQQELYKLKIDNLKQD
jgi:hypothetical protein